MKPLNTILIIQNDIVYRNFLFDCLPQYEIINFQTLKEGKCYLCKNTRIDLVILDLKLPDSVHILTSYSLIRYLRKDIPILLLNEGFDGSMIKILESDKKTFAFEKDSIDKRKQIEKILESFGFVLKSFQDWQDSIKKRIKLD